jgi:hypothetical protein
MVILAVQPKFGEEHMKKRFFATAMLLMVCNGGAAPATDINC